MYQDLKQNFWWNAMEGDSPVYGQGLGLPEDKIEYQRIAGLL